MSYVFVRNSDRADTPKSVYIQNEKMFDDALFEFVFTTLGYIPIEIKGKDIEVREV